MADLIPSLRAASQKLVREWGFLRPTFGVTGLSPTAVHCLVEIGDRSSCAFAELCGELRVLPAELRLIVADLVSDCHIKTVGPPARAAEGEAGVERYSLTPSGLEILENVNAYAQNQIAKALQVAHTTFGADITTALGLYAAALETARLSEANPSPALTPIATPVRAPSPPGPAARIVSGYQPGILGRTMEMHTTFYCPHMGWGREFETELGAGIADLLGRLDNPRNQVWAAVRTMPPRGLGKPAEERIVGVLYVDGEYNKAEKDVAQIRAFILDDDARGLGLGKKLIGEAMKFIREAMYRECRLTTERSLAAAIKLYEREGFVQVGEKWETRWRENGHMALFFAWHAS